MHLMLTLVVSRLWVGCFSSCVTWFELASSSTPLRIGLSSAFMLSQVSFDDYNRLPFHMYRFAAVVPLANLVFLLVHSLRPTTDSWNGDAVLGPESR